MNYQEIQEYFVKLNSLEQDKLLAILDMSKEYRLDILLHTCQKELDNKQGTCPHCSSSKYRKDGHEKIRV